MPDRYTPEEFARLLAHWAPEERAIFEERMRGAPSAQLTRFSPLEAALMADVLARLIPQQEGVDLVGFIDAYADQPLGRGDRRPGMPDTVELIHRGLKSVNETARQRHGCTFRKCSAEEQDDLLRAIAADEAPKEAWGDIPSSYFFERFYALALQGYFSHPRVWMRIGFPGSAYPEGYVWVTKGRVRARHERKPGWSML